MNEPGINMPIVIDLLRRQWRTLMAFALFASIVAAVTVFISPRYYRSSARLVAANGSLADKANIFNDHIQQLYSYFGSGDELDRIHGMAMLGTNLGQLVDSFKLIEYYQLSGNDTSLLKNKAILKLKKDLSIQRTEEGQLYVQVWTRDKMLSANLVNGLLTIVEQQAAEIWLRNYQRSRRELELSVSKAESQYQLLFDSLPRSNSKQFPLVQSHMQSLLDQLKQYRSAAEQFRVMEQVAPPIMYILEPASPAARSERPDKIVAIASAALAGFFFGVLWLLFTAKKPE